MKRLILICGLPGSGKSTFAEYLAQETGGVALAADDFMTDANGEYEFNPTRLKECHAACIAAAEEALMDDGETDTVVIHNTFTMEWERQPYRVLAQKMGAQITELAVMSGQSSATLALRNAHSVPLDKIVEMRKRFSVAL